MSWMLKEIKSQPAALSKMLDAELKKATAIGKAAAARNPSFFMLAARGSSDNAALYGKYLFEMRAKAPTVLAAPSEFTVYKSPPKLKGGVVIGISQSGQAPDIIETLAEARRQGAFTVAVTNTAGAPICDAADETIFLHAGKEKGLAATKTYTTQLLAMMMFSAAYSGDSKLMDELKSIPDMMEKTLAVESEARDLCERYRYMEHCVMIGRGYNYSTVKEAALKLMETCYVVAQPFSTADFMHGPIAIAGTGFPTFVVAPEGRMRKQLDELCGSLAEKGLETIVVSPSGRKTAGAVKCLRVPAGINEILSPLAYIVPFQFLAHFLSGAKGLDPDHPRFLKKVTRTL